MDFFLLVHLLLVVCPSLSTAQSTCPKDEDSCGFLGSGTNVGNECRYWRNGASFGNKQGEASPFNNPSPDSCATYVKCKTDQNGVKGSDSTWDNECDSDRYYYMCETCSDGYSMTKYAEGTVGGSCPVTNNYADNCYKRETWTTNFPSMCPESVSPVRRNQCYYKSGQSWGNAHEAGTPETNPVDGCMSYTLCQLNPVRDSQLPDPGSTETVIETYWAMCNACLPTHYASDFNVVAKTSMCAANSMITQCTFGTRPDDPVTPPPGPAPTPAPAPKIRCDGVFQKMLGCETESWMVAAFFTIFVSFLFLICYIFHAKKKRQKKKVKRIKEEAKLKQENALAKAKAIEMKSRIKAMKKKGVSRQSLSPEELAAKEAQKEAKRAEMKKRREEKEAILHSAFEDGLPPNWEVFTDPTYNQVYYVNVQTGETSWTRPKLEKIVEVEKHVVTENPLQNEENQKLKEQMKMLVDQNRSLKKEAMQKDKTSLVKNIPIREAKKKKATGMWKSGIAKAKMQSGGSSTADKLKAAVDAAKADQQIRDAQAMVPKAPGPPPSGPKPSEIGAAAAEAEDNQV
mmetsp:Transcript_8063/g.16286  ORF Transcript_8063/g.16286 Transcript_8063/m.16286 type:complete len:570 (-) Transcript_8063:73-1782(-)